MGVDVGRWADVVMVDCVSCFLIVLVFLVKNYVVIFLVFESIVGIVIFSNCRIFIMVFRFME